MPFSVLLARLARLAAGALATWLLLPSLAVAQPSFPATEAGARALLSQFLPASTADKAAATKRLQPTLTDYRAVYKEPLASKLDDTNRRHWQGGAIIGGKPDQTELLVVFAMTDDLVDGKPVMETFPGGYRRVTDKMNRGVPIVRFKFTRPGADLGMAFDGLVHVNGRWVFMPKPWQALEP